MPINEPDYFEPIESEEPEETESEDDDLLALDEQLQRGNRLGSWNQMEDEDEA